MTNYIFESRNVPGFFIRHAAFQGELSRMDGAPDDYAFTMVRRGGHSVFAFRSVNFPDRYLRHRDFRIHLDTGGPGDPLFDQDSGFTLVRGLAGEHLRSAPDESFSFRSVNFPDRYLRHRDFHLWVEAPRDQDDALFREDATFVRRLAPVRID